MRLKSLNNCMMKITYEITEAKDGRSRMAKMYFKSEGIDEVGIFRSYIHKPYIDCNAEGWNRQCWIRICKTFGKICQDGYESVSNKNPLAISQLGFMTSKKHKSKKWLLLSISRDVRCNGRLETLLCFQICKSRQCSVDTYEAYQSVWYDASASTKNVKYYTIATEEEGKAIGQVFIDMADTIYEKELDIFKSTHE